jgi:hypothetical protein
MSTLNKIECVKRFILLESHVDLLEWIVDNKIVSRQSWNASDSVQLRAELIVSSLAKAEEQERLMLLDYEWSILPKEFIKITCVNDREKREFIFGA